MVQVFLPSKFPSYPTINHVSKFFYHVSKFSYHVSKLSYHVSMCPSYLTHVSSQLLVDFHCSYMGPHLGPLVPMGTFFSFWVPIFFKVLIFSILVPVVHPNPGLRTRKKSVQFVQNALLGPHFCRKRSPLGPHFDKFRSSLHVGAVDFEHILNWK